MSEDDFDDDLFLEVLIVWLLLLFFVAVVVAVSTAKINLCWLLTSKYQVTFKIIVILYFP